MATAFSKFGEEGSKQTYANMDIHIMFFLKMGLAKVPFLYY